ncbi:hypothetical protein HYV82_06310 [Candidatus Woesearchaeota archaeon]|nr:hypothetical protein [Candidatus Woesearchaeota archaeon]
MRALADIVESEAPGRHSRLWHDVEEAMASREALAGAREERKELAARIASQEGRAVQLADLINTVPFTPFTAASPYAGYAVAIDEENQPFGIKAAAEMQERAEQLRRGEIDFRTYYKITSLFPALKIIENWLDTYEAHREDTIADKIYNVLTNLQGQEQAYKRAFLPRWLLEGAKTLAGRVSRPYRRPGNLAAMHARQGELGGLAFSIPGQDTVGTFYEGMFNYQRTMKELNLYGKSELLIEYIVEHELTHLSHPEMEEGEVREFVYNKYSAKVAGLGSNESSKYLELARIASAFAHGHSGVGPMSVASRIWRNKKKYFDMVLGRHRPDANGSEIYTGTKLDEPEMMRRGSGSIHPQATAAYRESIGKPLSRPESESAPHEPGQNEAASPESATPKSASATSAEYHAGHNEYGSPEPATNDYSAPHEAAEAAA